jgi:hypothetical protein
LKSEILWCKLQTIERPEFCGYIFSSNPGKNPVKMCKNV